MKVFNFFIFLILILPTFNFKSIENPARSPSSINRAAIALTTPSKIFYGSEGNPLSPEVVISYNQQHQVNPVATEEFIPLSIQPSDNQNHVFSQIADRSIQTMWNTPAVQESVFAKQVNEVEKKSAVRVEFQSTVHHIFNMNLQAFQHLAELKYSGLTDARIQFFADQSLLRYQLNESLGTNTLMSLSHDVSPTEHLSRLSVKVQF